MWYVAAAHFSGKERARSGAPGCLQGTIGYRCAGRMGSY